MFYGLGYHLVVGVDCRGRFVLTTGVWGCFGLCRGWLSWPWVVLGMAWCVLTVGGVLICVMGGGRGRAGYDFCHGCLLVMVFVFATSR